MHFTLRHQATTICNFFFLECWLQLPLGNALGYADSTALCLVKATEVREVHFVIGTLALNPSPPCAVSLVSVSKTKAYSYPDNKALILFNFYLDFYF